MEMNIKEHSLLVEKYRSKDLTEYVGNEHIKTQIQKYLDQDDIQNFIFYGPAGTEKQPLLNLLLIIWSVITFMSTLLMNEVLKLLGIKSQVSQALYRLERLKLSSLMRRIFSPSKHKHL